MDQLSADFQRARDGDRTAFGRIQGALEQPLRRYIQRLIGMGDMAEDVLQDAFLALYMNMERIDPMENVRPFLYRVVRNLCYDELRKRWRYGLRAWQHEAMEEAARLVPISVSISDRLHWCMLLQGVTGAMEELPEGQRQVMRLFCRQGLSYAQIAELLGVSVGTVKSRLYYARASLVRILGLELLEGLGLEQGYDGGGQV